MPSWLLYGLAALAIVTAIGGGYYFINNLIETKDKKIEELRQELSDAAVNLENMTNAYNSAKAESNRMRSDLVAAQAQATRIKQADAAERARQAAFDRSIQGVVSQDALSLDAINRYQDCIKDVTNTECGKLLGR